LFQNRPLASYSRSACCVLHSPKLKAVSLLMFDFSLCTNTSDFLRRPLPPFSSLGCLVDPKANDTDNQKTGKSDGKPNNETVVVKGMIARGGFWTRSCLCRRRSGWIPAGYRVTGKCFWWAGRKSRGVAGLPLDIPRIVHLDAIGVVCSRRYEMSCYGFGKGGRARLGYCSVRSSWRGGGF
jgi:hypothetical protein